MVASVSKTPFTSFFATSFSAAIFSISCDFVIWAAIYRSSSLIRCDAQYLGNEAENCQNLTNCTALLVINPSPPGDQEIEFGGSPHWTRDLVRGTSLRNASDH